MKHTTEDYVSILQLHLLKVWSKFKAQMIVLCGGKCDSDKLSSRAEMVGAVGKMAAREADVEMTSMGIISSSQASALVSSPRLYGHHCFPPLPRTAGSYRADTLEICAIITLSSAWNVYSNNQTYGVIPIDLDFPRARVINRTDRNVCDARNDRSR